MPAKPTPIPADLPDLLTVGEVAALLGYSLNTVRRWADAGELVMVRTPGRQRRITRQSVEDLLEQLHP